MKQFLVNALFAILPLLLACSRHPIEITLTDELSEADKSMLKARLMAGGATTIFTRTSAGFELPAPNLSAGQLTRHTKGDIGFEAVFVTAPSYANPGLGDLLNNVSCISCHTRDGRAPFPTNFAVRQGLLVRISVGNDPIDGPIAAPGFGGQVQNHAVNRQKPEADYNVTFEERTERLSDGEVVSLRKPVITLANTYIPLPSGVLLSPRMGSTVFGSGLLEAADERDILLHEDKDDRDGDGISGRANYVWNPQTQKTELGRFGWKANTSNLLIQSAAAYVNDMGITSYIFPKEPWEGQTNAGSISSIPEITNTILDDVTFYLQTLAVPAPATVDDPNVIKGAITFEKIGCAKCHIPEMKTRYNSNAALSNQTFFPYTDLLIHDMGEGLADGRPDFLADGKEWRTRPLWGIGLTETIIGEYTNFLHDGRARNITEAIMWHGGEAQRVKDRFVALGKTERQNLLKFINSL